MAAILLVTAVTLGLQLHLRLAAEMFLKNEDLKRKDKQLIAILDSLTEGVMVFR